MQKHAAAWPRGRMVEVAGRREGAEGRCSRRWRAGGQGPYRNRKSRPARLKEIAMTPAQLYPGFDLDCPAIKAPIEPGVKPLCDALNALPGVHTLWSCEGHPRHASRPYVTFIAPADTAFAVHQAIGKDHEAVGLHFSWNMVATFRDDGTMQYTIEPNDYRVSQGSWRRWWSSRRWDHRTMAADLARMAALIPPPAIPG